MRKRINSALKDLNVTQIVIAHRKETIEQSDRVMVCLQGQIRTVNLRPKSDQAGGESPTAFENNVETVKPEPSEPGINVADSTSEGEDYASSYA
jgi:ABC-type sulfate/molybdate transport systems ATPase subunit